MTIPTVIEWANNKPVVYLPEGTKLSNKFTLEAGRPLTVKNLLTNGDQNTKLAKSNKKQKSLRRLAYRWPLLRWPVLGICAPMHRRHVRPTA